MEAPNLKKLWTESKTKNKMLLMNNSFNPAYPSVDDDFTESFITDYKQNHSYYDRMFVQKYASRVPMYLEDHTTTTAFLTEWQEMVEAIISTNLHEWAVLYFALRQKFNPLYNVDGTEKKTIKGQTLKESGTETHSDVLGETNTTEDIGNTNVETTSFSVPYDTNTEKETGRTSSLSNAIQNTSKVDEHENETTITFGKKNDVDYSETLTRAGNIGVTKSTDLIDATRTTMMTGFYDSIFKKIADTLTLWEV